MGLTRAFLCIEFPDNVIKEIARVQEIVRKKKFTGKVTELENLHLTLKFFGEIEEFILKEIRERLKRVKFEQMDLKLGRIGLFSHNKNPRIIWIKVEGKGVWELQEKVDDVLADLFKKEERFMSHLTIARVKYVKDKDDFLDYIRNIRIRDIEFKVNRFKLKRSELGVLGPVYTDIEEYVSEDIVK